MINLSSIFSLILGAYFYLNAATVSADSGKNYISKLLREAPLDVYGKAADLKILKAKPSEIANLRQGIRLGNLFNPLEVLAQADLEEGASELVLTSYRTLEEVVFSEEGVAELVRLDLEIQREFVEGVKKVVVERKNYRTKSGDKDLIRLIKFATNGEKDKIPYWWTRSKLKKNYIPKAEERLKAMEDHISWLEMDFRNIQSAKAQHEERLKDYEEASESIKHQAPLDYDKEREQIVFLFSSSEVLRPFFNPILNAESSEELKAQQEKLIQVIFESERKLVRAHESWDRAYLLPHRRLFSGVSSDRAEERRSQRISQKREEVKSLEKHIEGLILANRQLERFIASSEDHEGS